MLSFRFPSIAPPPVYSFITTLNLARRAPRRWCDGITNVLRPYSTVKFTVKDISLAIGSENVDVDALDRSGTRDQNIAPSPGNDIACVPDVQSGDLIDAGFIAVLGCSLECG